MDLELKIKQRISELKKSLEEYIILANQQISAYKAAIGELENLLTHEEKQNDSGN